MQSTEPTSMETDSVIIRRLRPSDLEPVIAIDAKAPAGAASSTSS